MKICVVSYGSIVRFDGKSFTNPAINDLLNHLAKHHDVTYIAGLAGNNSSVCKNGKPVYTRPIEMSVKIKPLAGNNNSGLISQAVTTIKNVIGLFKSIKQSDLAYIYLPGYTNLLVCILCIIAGRKYALYVGSDWETLKDIRKKGFVQDSVYRHAYAFLVGRIYDRASFILVTGKKLYRDISAVGRNVFEAVPSVSFKMREGDEAKTWDHIEKGVINLFFAGPINPLKGIHYLVRSLPLLSEKGVTAHLHLAGAVDESYRSTLEEEIKEHASPDSVTFYGYVPDKETLRQIFLRADVLVVPSLAEGFPRVIYEAMMLRLPVISTSLPSIIGNLDDPEIICFVPPRDPEAIADAAIGVIRDPQQRQLMIEKGFELIKRRIGGEEHYEQVEALINKYT